MFCPRCKYEYNEGVKECPDCGAEMVAELLKEKSEEEIALETENDMVHIYDTGDQVQIHLIKEIFNEKEIIFYIRDVSSLQHHRFGETGENNSSQIYVEKIRADEAKEILEDIKSSEQVDEKFLDWRKNESADDVGVETAELCEVNNEIEAAAIKSMLDSDEIYSYLRSNLLPSSRVALFFFKQKGFGTIIVNKEELKKAQQVLEDYKRSL